MQESRRYDSGRPLVRCCLSGSLRRPRLHAALGGAVGERAGDELASGSEADDSHTNLDWDSKLGVLAGRNVEWAAPVHAALAFDGAGAVGHRRRERERSSTAASRSHDVQQALAWLGRQRLPATRRRSRCPFTRCPRIAVGEGARVFRRTEPTARTELAVMVCKRVCFDSRKVASALIARQHRLCAVGLTTSTRRP